MQEQSDLTGRSKREPYSKHKWSAKHGFVTGRMTGSWPIVLNERRNERRSNVSSRPRNSSHVSQILQFPLTNRLQRSFSCFARSFTEFPVISTRNARDISYRNFRIFLFERRKFFLFFLFLFSNSHRTVVLIAKFKQNDVPLIVYNFIVDGRGGKIIFRNNKPNLNLALKGSNVQKKEK